MSTSTLGSHLLRITSAVTTTATTTTTLMPVGEVSPVTLSSDWSRVARLLLLAALGIAGSVGNVFMISAVIVEDHLKRRGNTFIVNIALADLLVTGLLIPASAVVILASADIHAPLSVCRFQWFLAALNVLVCSVSHAQTAAETYARMVVPPQRYEVCFTRRVVTIVAVSTWALCTAVSASQFVVVNNGRGFDYCTRIKDRDFLPYQAVIGVSLIAAPVLITFIIYIRIAHRQRSNPIPPGWDPHLTSTNTYSFVIFVIFWLPFATVLTIGTAPDRLFYNLAWFALSKSCVNNLCYGVANRNFRCAYVNLFHYCCCKTTVAFSRGRPRGCIGGGGGGGGVGVGVGGGGVGSTGRPTGDVRVHIIPGYNMYTSPQRAGTCGGGGGGGMGGGGGKNGGRNVYEL